MRIPNAISILELYHFVGTKECPIIIDVRIVEDFEDDPRIIPGALKRNFNSIELIAQEFAHQKVIIYCQKGFKISQGSAALLRQIGVDADFLVGGQFAWRDAKFPMVKASSVLRDTNESTSLWVTGYHPKIEGIACSWLIRRFVDPTAKILFVEPSQVMNVADRFNATPFDVEDVPFSNFDKMLEEFGLIASEPLTILARIVRGAVTNHYDVAPEAAGLNAISLGLSCMYSDDLKQLDAGMMIYDAYYLWARDVQNKGDVKSSTINTASFK